MEPNGSEDFAGQNASKVEDLSPAEAEIANAPHELISDEVINFSEETRELLARKGFTIYDLEGKTVEELTQELGAEWVNMHETHMLHKREKSFKGQIAFKPGEDGAQSLGAEFLNPGQAQVLVSEYDEAVQEKIPGARAVMASVGTTLAIIAKHKQNNAEQGIDDPLFSRPIYGEEIQIRTSTVDNKWNKLAVGVGSRGKRVSVSSIPAQPEHFTKPQRTYAFIVPSMGVAA